MTAYDQKPVFLVFRSQYSTCRDTRHWSRRKCHHRDNLYRRYCCSGVFDHLCWYSCYILADKDEVVRFMNVWLCFLWVVFEQLKNNKTPFVASWRFGKTKDFETNEPHQPQIKTGRKISGPQQKRPWWLHKYQLASRMLPSESLQGQTSVHIIKVGFFLSLCDVSQDNTTKGPPSVPDANTRGLSGDTCVHNCDLQISIVFLAWTKLLICTELCSHVQIRNVKSFLWSPGREEQF